MGTNYPASLDTTTNQPVASALTGVELDGDGNANKVHSTLHGVHSEAIVAIEGKIGTGASTATANKVLRATGTGTSAWAQVGLTTDVTGTLPVANGGIGTTALTNLITLGTHTTGNYLATLANATNGGTTIANSGSETAAATVAMNMNDLAAGVMADGDSIAFIDADDNATKKEALADLLDTVAGTVGTTGLDRSGATLVVTDLHPVGVSGSANQLLTDDGDGTVTSEANLTFDGTTLTASGVALSEAASVNISTPILGTTDHTYSGLTATMLMGGNVPAMQLVCVHTVNNEVVLADASAYATARAIGINPTNAQVNDTNSGAILLQGFVRDSSWSWTAGSTLYLSETSGVMTHTAPTTDGAFVQVVGVALSDVVVYINPSMDVIEHA